MTNWSEEFLARVAYNLRLPDGDLAVREFRFHPCLPQAEPEIGFIAYLAEALYNVVRRRITIKQDTDYRVFASLHEMGHALLHHGKRFEPNKRQDMEDEANTVAFSVCRMFGIDTKSVCGVTYRNRIRRRHVRAAVAQLAAAIERELAVNAAGSQAPGVLHKEAA